MSIVRTRPSPICFRFDGVGSLRHQCPVVQETLDQGAILLRSRQLLSVGGRRGLLIRSFTLRLQLASLRSDLWVQLVSRGTLGIPRRVRLTPMPTLLLTNRRSAGVLQRGVGLSSLPHGNHTGGHRGAPSGEISFQCGQETGP